MEQPIEIREQVKEVSVDMWGGFPKVIRKVFPNAKIVIDRFHVMKMVNKALNDLRKKLGVTYKKSRYLLLKNGADLNEEQRDELMFVLSLSPTLNIAYEMKEDFIAIYEKSRTPGAGGKKIKKWLQGARIFWPELCKTILKHMSEISNYFISRLTNGFIEGVNNKIKLIKRQGYGFTNMKNFRARLMASFRHRPSSSP